MATAVYHYLSPMHVSDHCVSSIMSPNGTNKFAGLGLE